MRRFAFLVHPRDRADIEWYRDKDPGGIERSLATLAPLHLTDLCYRGAEGMLVAVPLTTRQMARLPRRYVRQRVLDAARFCIDRGAAVIGLGAMTSVVTRAGVWLTERVDAIVTNGNALTAATAANQVLATMKPSQAWSLGVIGGSGSVGLCIARMLAPSCREVTLVGKSRQTLAYAKRVLASRTVRCTTETIEVADLDALVVATAGPDPVISIGQIGNRTRIFDLSVPSNVLTNGPADARLYKAGHLHLEGVDLTCYDPGLAPGLVYACLAETILYALDEDLADHSVGHPDPMLARGLAGRAAANRMAAIL